MTQNGERNTLAKDIFVSRLTNEEAVLFENKLDASTAKFRLFYESINDFQNDEPIFSEMMSLLTNVFDEERANELLLIE